MPSTQQVIRAVLLGSFTLDHLPATVDGRISGAGFSVEWCIAPFNQYQQWLLDPPSDFRRFRPEVVFVAVAAEDLLAGMPTWTAASAEREAFGNDRTQSLVRALEQAAADNPNITFAVHNLFPSQRSSHPLLAQKLPSTAVKIVASANARLCELAERMRNVFVLDLAGVAAEVGLRDFYDPRYYYLGSIRFGARGLEAVAACYSRFLGALLGKRRKCIVVDLDDTLWGGVLGDLGIEHILVGSGGIGHAFQDLQRVLMEYHDTGVLLAICSKNDQAIAMQAVCEHPGMVLRPEHFAAVRINWQDKAANLQSIAQELNIGLDSLVFIDDSAFERGNIRFALPRVEVVELPPDPAEYARSVAGLECLDLLALTEEDKRRNTMQRHENERQNLRRRTSTIDEYLFSLRTEAMLCPGSRSLAPRLAQLTQKTNQFNLTTRRYLEADVLDRLQDRAWRVYGFHIKDQMGESGIVAAAFVHVETTRARLDTFVVSCRVLGRGVEKAFLAAIADQLRAEGVAELLGEFRPTERNGVSADFLASSGFNYDHGMWIRSVREPLPSPTWIVVRVLDGETHG